MHVGDETHLIGLVVVLGVVLEDLRPLRVLEGADQLLDAHIGVRCPPLLALDEPGHVNRGALHVWVSRHSHLLGELDVELACTQKSQLSTS